MQWSDEISVLARGVLSPPPCAWLMRALQRRAEEEGCSSPALAAAQFVRAVTSTGSAR